MTKNIQLDKITCTACYACVASCSQQCIHMQEDKLGFLRPVIDNAACISCGKCISVCEHVKQLPEIDEEKQQIYAAKHRSSDVKNASSSGGVFTALSDAVLEMGGVICGSVYSEHMKPIHTFAENKVERDAMRGSKYTYSLCNDLTYRRVKSFLNNGRKVLFTGTPCQVSALKCYVGEHENLFTVDILCHGIVAPVLYRDFVRNAEKKGKVVFIDFRRGNINWHDPVTCITYRNGKIVIDNSYFKMFTQNYLLRESCYKCNFASFNRISEITIGDFWGIENCHSEFDEADGVSVMIVNNEKGRTLLAQCHANLELLRCTRSDCSHEQLNGLPARTQHQEFKKYYLSHGYNAAYKKFVRESWSIRIRERLYRNKLILNARNQFAKLLGK